MNLVAGAEPREVMPLVSYQVICRRFIARDPRSRRPQASRQTGSEPFPELMVADGLHVRPNEVVLVVNLQKSLVLPEHRGGLLHRIAEGNQERPLLHRLWKGPEPGDVEVVLREIAQIPVFVVGTRGPVFLPHRNHLPHVRPEERLERCVVFARLPRADVVVPDRGRAVMKTESSAVMPSRAPP